MASGSNSVVLPRWSFWALLGCGCLPLVLWSVLAGSGIVRIGQLLLTEVWLSETARPITVTTTRREFTHEKRFGEGLPVYRSRQCDQTTFFQMPGGQEHFIQTFLHHQRCRGGETGDPALLPGQQIQVRKSSLYGGYALPGWNTASYLGAGLLAALILGSLWLLRKSRFIWPELQAWASRGPKN